MNKLNVFVINRSIRFFLKVRSIAVEGAQIVLARKQNGGCWRRMEKKTVEEEDDNYAEEDSYAICRQLRDFNKKDICVDQTGLVDVRVAAHSGSACASEVLEP